VVAIAAAGRDVADGGGAIGTVVEVVIHPGQDLGGIPVNRGDGLVGRVGSEIGESFPGLGGVGAVGTC